MTANDAKAAEEETPQLTNDELEAKINEVDKRLSKAIADLGKDVTDQLTDLSKSVNDAVNEMKKIKAKATGNETRLGSMESSLKTLTTDVGKAKTAAGAITQRLDALEQFQGELNTAIFKGLQAGKDFTLEETKAAKNHADQAVTALDGKVGGIKTDLENRIQAVADAPVKQHTHKLHITLDGTTGGPDGGNA